MAFDIPQNGKRIKSNTGLKEDHVQGLIVPRPPEKGKQKGKGSRPGTQRVTRQVAPRMCRLPNINFQHAKKGSEGRPARTERESRKKESQMWYRKGGGKRYFIEGAGEEDVRKKRYKLDLKRFLHLSGKKT